MSTTQRAHLFGSPDKPVSLEMPGVSHHGPLPAQPHLSEDRGLQPSPFPHILPRAGSSHCPAGPAPARCCPMPTGPDLPAAARRPRVLTCPLLPDAYGS